MKEEQTLFESAPEGFSLTTHKARKISFKSGKPYLLTSLLLEDVTGCEIRISSKRWILYTAAIVMFLGVQLIEPPGEGFFAQNGPYESILTVVLLLMVAAWFATRKKVLSISSPSTRLDLDIKGMEPEEAIGLVDKIEVARSSRSSSIQS